MLTRYNKQSSRFGQSEAEEELKILMQNMCCLQGRGYHLFLHSPFTYGLCELMCEVLAPKRVEALC